MVKLPENASAGFDQPIWQELVRNRVERSGRYTTTQPSRLLELEEYANFAAINLKGNERFAAHESKGYLRQYAMNELRAHYKLEFKLLCHICHTPHYQDEITAPER